MPSGSALRSAPVDGAAGAGAGAGHVLAGRPVAASTALRDRLNRPARGRVLAAFPCALYVGLQDVGLQDAGGSDVVAVVTTDGLRLPNALVLAAPSSQAPFAVHRPGTAARLADGALQVGPLTYRPVREWAARTVAAGLPQPAAVQALAGLLADGGPGHDRRVHDALADGTALLSAALVDADPSTARAAADALIGLGPGLTPSGDDLLAGALVTCAVLTSAPDRAVVGPALAELRTRIATRAAARTTALSAALLRHAAAGRAAEPVLAVLDAVAGRRPVRPAVQLLRAVGHSSGSDTARGILTAAEALLALAARRPPEPGSARRPPSSRPPSSRPPSSRPRASHPEAL